MTSTTPNKPALPYPAKKLIPHQPPMLFIDQLIERSADKAVVTITSLSEKLLFQDPDNRMSLEFFIEILAQTTAAANGYDCLMNNKKQKTGYLTRLDEFFLTQKPFPKHLLTAETEKKFSFENITLFHGKLSSGELLLASGKFQIWQEKAP